MIRPLLIACFAFQFALLTALTAAPARAEEKAVEKPAAASAEPHRRILFFTRSQGFQHSVVVTKGDKPCFAETVLRPIAEKHNWELVVTKDGGVFTAENLAKFDAIIFYTTGNLTEAKSSDGSPPMSVEGKAALLDAIKAGKGFVGFHCASDTFHSKSSTQLDPYIEMLGGEFITHGKQQKAELTVTDGKFPGAAAMGEKFEAVEEWYGLKNFAPDMHVILVQETGTMQGGIYQRPPYPETWARMHGKGRVFYSSMGHREDLWQNPKFQSLFVGGISWAVGNVEADVTPNFKTATPAAWKDH